MFKAGDIMVINGVKRRVTHKYIRVREGVRLLVGGILGAAILYGLMYVACAVAYAFAQ